MVKQSKSSVYFFNNREEVEEKIWSLFNDALLIKDSPFKTPVFSNIQDGKPSAKTVVLRSIDKTSKTLFFHSDYRSAKIHYLKIDPICCLTFYNKDEKIQLRVNAQTKIHYQDHISLTAWQNTAHYSRKCYLIDQAPGKILESPGNSLPKEFLENGYTMEESEIGYKNFCVIKCSIISIDWLYLAAQGHTRAVINYKNTKNRFSWIVP